MTTTSSTKPDELRIAEAYSAVGYSDILLLDLDQAEHILTAKRRELLDTIKTEDIESIRDLARTVDRDPNAVMRDIKILVENGLITFNKEDDRKIPQLQHEKVVIEPVI